MVRRCLVLLLAPLLGYLGSLQVLGDDLGVTLNVPLRLV